VAGLASYWRLYDQGGTVCHYQGTVFPLIVEYPSVDVAIGDSILNFASTTALSVGMWCDVDGLSPDWSTVILAKTSTTITLSKTATTSATTSTPINFGGDMFMTDVNLVLDQTYAFNQINIYEVGE
jgi:hypothetical protein